MHGAQKYNLLRNNLMSDSVFAGMSSDDEETLPKISFGSFTSSQECKREPGATGPTSTGSPPTDPRMISKIGKRQGYRPSPRTELNGDRNGSGSGAAIGDHPRGSVGGRVGGPIRKRRSRSARARNPARNPVYNVVRNQRMT
jgi:hypothetical protein